MRFIIFIHLIFLASCSQAPVYDFVIRNATIVDGSGEASYRGDVAISSDTIVAVGKVEGRGVDEIDASGKIVSPGLNLAKRFM